MSVWEAQVPHILLMVSLDIVVSQELIALLDLPHLMVVPLDHIILPTDKMTAYHALQVDFVT